MVHSRLQLTQSPQPLLLSCLSLRRFLAWISFLPPPATRGALSCKAAIEVGGDASAYDQGACNTPGVCHQLSNGFELEHGILSDDEDVKVKPIETSPNLNLDIAPFARL